MVKKLRQFTSAKNGISFWGWIQSELKIASLTAEKKCLQPSWEKNPSSGLKV